MFPTKSITKLKSLFMILSLQGITCSIDGSFSKHQSNGTKPGEDPCNPLYWYPQNIPEYCNFKTMPTTPTDPLAEFPLPIPVPVPMPAPLPMLPPPVLPPIMMPRHEMPPGPLAPVPVPHPIMPLPISLPFGIPLAPTNPMVPVAGIPLPPPTPAFPMPFPPQYSLNYGSAYLPPAIVSHRSPFSLTYQGAYPARNPFYPPPFPMPPRSGIGMVPGIPGMVSSDGGINIMPFSDAYSDMLEKHKQKLIRRRLQNFLGDYDRPPWKIGRKIGHPHAIKYSNEEKFYHYASE